MHPFFESALVRGHPEKTVQGFPDFVADENTIQTLRAVYLGLATEVDAHVGRILQALRDNGQYDQTLIVVSADHGEMLGDRHLWGKMSCYDAAYHAPLIIRDPDHPKAFGQKVESPTESVDIAPTILNWIGRDIPFSMDGLSLHSFLSGQSPATWRNYSYSELEFCDPIDPTEWQKSLGLRPEVTNLAILRGARHTLVHFNGGLPPLLFDHDGQGEFENIAQNADARKPWSLA